MKKINILLVLTLLLILPIKALRADIVLNKMIVDFLPKGPKQENLDLFNRGKTIDYVSTKIFEIQNPGMKNEKRVEISKGNKNRLVIAPNKLTINPGTHKRFQFISTDKDLKKDKIYRVEIVPNISGIEAPKGSIGIKILVGYEVLAIVRPQKMDFKLKVVRDGENITFINEGNTNILLDNIKQCKTKNNCKTILANRLYAGNKITAKLAYKDKPVIAEMYYANEFKKETY